MPMWKLCFQVHVSVNFGLEKNKSSANFDAVAKIPLDCGQIWCRTTNVLV